MVKSSQVKAQTSRKQRIEARLTEVFSPSFLEVNDVSESHKGHAGASPKGETHYEVTISSEKFRGKTKIAQERLVHDTLKSEWGSGLHALALNLQIPQSIENDKENIMSKNTTPPPSPEVGNVQLGEMKVEFPILKGSIGPSVLDIGKFHSTTGMFTYDPGFMSTAACESKITYIDGEKGVLLYRGYPIEQLAEHGDFLETAYLLLNGELPTVVQKADFDHKITHRTMVHDQMSRFFQGFRRDAHPMALMVASVGALSAFYHDSTDITDPEQRLIASMRMIAKFPTLAAMAYKYVIGQPFVYPKNDLDYTSNFLRMCFSVPCEEYRVNKVISRALDRIFILHADHEQNASTSTVRLAGSSGANPFACIAAGTACLWGPAHGGANEAALKMLHEIGTPENIPKFIARAKDKNDHTRLMGFGHRVYKNYDPRARIMQRTCHEVLAELGIKDNPILDVALELERIALSDDYFISKKLYPNVDFYSGITLSAIGFPPSMFTALFALARTVGWIAQWKEMIEDPTQKIGRPRQLYTGPVYRDYLPISKRSER